MQLSIWASLEDPAPFSRLSNHTSSLTAVRRVIRHNLKVKFSTLRIKRYNYWIPNCHLSECHARGSNREDAFDRLRYYRIGILVTLCSTGSRMPSNDQMSQIPRNLILSNYLLKFKNSAPICFANASDPLRNSLSFEIQLFVWLRVMRPLVSHLVSSFVC